MTYRVVALGLAVAALGLAPATSGAPAAVSGNVVIAGSGTNWTLTIHNAASSTGPIRCWRYTFPPGVLAAGIGMPPAGWQVGGNRPPPAPVLGGRSNAGIPPGGSATFPIVTDKPFDTAGPPGTAAVSEDCVTDATARVTFSSRPQPTPCACERLDPKLSVSGVVAGAADRTGLTIFARLSWTMKCTGGTGTCRGRLEVSPAPGDARKGLRVFVGSNDGVIQCSGRCSRVTVGSRKAPITASTLQFDGSRIGNQVRSVRIEVERTCARKRPTLTLEIVFKRSAGKVQVDRAKSDLNGNDVPDGEE